MVDEKVRKTPGDLDCYHELAPQPRPPLQEKARTCPEVVVSTFCSQCTNVHEPSKRSHPRYWLCTRHKTTEGFGFVTPDTWDKAEPYMRCNQVNGGMCILFEPINTGDENAS